METFLGISAYYHDSAAALIQKGKIVAAAQEERFSRRKNDERFPTHALDYCLKQAGLTPKDLDAVIFYDKPITKFARMLETYLAVAPRGLGTFLQVMPNWLGEKLNLPRTLREEIPGLPDSCPVLFSGHHQAHAASAFYPSPFEEAAILTVDGVGEYATTTVGRGKGHHIEILKEIRFPHSLGLLYSAFTAYCGFRVNSGEYKLMGLAPYGKPRFTKAILEHLLDLKEDGSFRLNLDFFEFLHGTSMTHPRFHQLFGGPPRIPESATDQRHMDVARSIQAVTEEVLLRLSRHAREVTGLDRLCMAGGVALNCVANGRILRENIFEKIWIQPAAGDAGGALGAALCAWHERQSAEQTRIQSGTAESTDSMQGSLLGPAYDDQEIETVLQCFKASYIKLSEPELLEKTSDLLAHEKVVGWFQGRMEFGPRALGNRSILGDARSSRMQSTLNLKVKFRESFRPFAPIVLVERLKEYFDLNTESPYMLLVAPVVKAHQRPQNEDLQGLDLLKQERSTIPAVTHVDYSARIQSVDSHRNPLLYKLLKAFEKKTECGVLINTSFNVRGEPVVCSPEDAYRCFVNTQMDVLVMGSFLLERSKQPGDKVEVTFDAQPD